MPHLTPVPECRVSQRAWCNLEAHAEGFVSTPMAQCSFLAALWGGDGTNFARGCAIHGSGGLIEEDVDNLMNRVAAVNLTVVYVTGSLFDAKWDNLDTRFASGLQKVVTAKGWNIRRFAYDSKMGNFVVTRSGYMLTERQYQDKLKIRATLNDIDPENTLKSIVL